MNKVTSFRNRRLGFIFGALVIGMGVFPIMYSMRRESVTLMDKPLPGQAIMRGEKVLAVYGETEFRVSGAYVNSGSRDIGPDYSHPMWKAKLEKIAESQKAEAADDDDD